MENHFTARFFLAEHEATNTWLGTRHGGLSLIADVNVNANMITISTLIQFIDELAHKSL